MADTEGRVDGTIVLGEDDLRDVRSAVADLAARWKDLGISLGICLSDLDAIFSTNPQSPHDCLRETLALWLKQNYNVEKFGKPTWRRLVEAVEDKVGGNNCALAQKIALKWSCKLQFMCPTNKENGARYLLMVLYAVQGEEVGVDKFEYERRNCYTVQCCMCDKCGKLDIKPVSINFRRPIRNKPDTPNKHSCSRCRGKRNCPNLSY